MNRFSKMELEFEMYFSLKKLWGEGESFVELKSFKLKRLRELHNQRVKEEEPPPEGRWRDAVRLRD